MLPIRNDRYARKNILHIDLLRPYICAEMIFFEVEMSNFVWFNILSVFKNQPVKEFNAYN